MPSQRDGTATTISTEHIAKMATPSREITFASMAAGFAGA
jgi:hypothetical protein